MRCTYLLSFFFFFNDTATTEIYTLSLHDALPIYLRFRSERRMAAGEDQPQSLVGHGSFLVECVRSRRFPLGSLSERRDRKSTRLNSSHSQISYAVFCLKKKKSHVDIRPWQHSVDS